jgi:O-antigen/teichoic acid export membrane protein
MNLPASNHRLYDPAPSAPRFGDGPVSGAALMTAAKLATSLIAFASVMIVARILRPADYGLVAMAMSLVLFFTVFSDFGLSLVTVQRPDLSCRQLTALFWTNLAFGLALGAINAALAPLLAWFYGDPRVLPICLALSIFFPIAALGAQQQALLKRDMLFRRLAMVRVIGSAAGPLAAILLAVMGAGYWSLAGQMLVTAGATTIAAWCAVAWRPGKPATCDGLRSMLGFGGALTAHGMVGYLANTMDSILLGRFAGPSVLGVYSQSYNVMMRPIALAAYGVGETAIPALSRAGGETARRATFRRMYSLTCILGIPICVAGAWWADDIVWTLLGAQWRDAIPVLRALFIAAAARMLLAPTGWIYVATGRPGRMLKWQLLWTPFVVAAFALGLPGGAFGVAAGYAIALWASLIPGILFCFRGTELTLLDVLSEISKPALCALAATSVAVALQVVLVPDAPAGIARLCLRIGVAGSVYAFLVCTLVPLANECWREGARRFRICFAKVPAV